MNSGRNMMPLSDLPGSPKKALLFISGTVVLKDVFGTAAILADIVHHVSMPDFDRTAPSGIVRS